MNHIEKKAFDIPTFCQMHSIGRTRLYKEIKEGRLQVLKLGRRTLISAEAAAKWLSDLAR